MRWLVIAIVMVGTAAHAACPTGQALADVAATAFPEVARVDTTTCTAVRTHAGARWLLVLDTGTTGLLVAVVTTNGKVAWACCGIGGGGGQIVDATAADLDGDGTDELVLTTRDATNTRAVGVQSLDGKHGDSIALAPGEQWHVGKRELEIDDAAGNAQHYRWRGAALEHS